jgi:hypothetical protein
VTKAAQPTGIDIFAIDPIAACEVGADIEITHPASQRGLGVFLKIIGNESDEIRAYAKRKVIEQTHKNFSKRSGRKPDAEQLAQQTVDRIFDRTSSVELAMVATKGWWRYKTPDAEKAEERGRVETLLFNNEELSFSADNLRKVLEARPWIATQVDTGVQELDNFFTS